jgi:hypothetical protein
MLSPRNKIELHHVMPSEVETVDTLFEICDAEFNSRKDVHESFKASMGPKRWARFYLLHEVQKVANREGISCSHHLAHIVATEIARMWNDCRLTAE